MSHWNRRRPPIEKRDGNESQIVAALLDVRASVDKLPGDGRPDLLVGFAGRTYLLEVKMEDASNRRMRKDEVAAGGEFAGLSRTLTRRQAQWWKAWEGLPPVIVRTVHDALVAIGAPCSCSSCAAVAEADEVLAGPVPFDTTEESQHRFGAIVRAARIAADKSQREVASAMGITLHRLDQIERGHREPLPIAQWPLLSDAIPGLCTLALKIAFERYHAWADDLDDVVRQDAALPRDP